MELSQADVDKFSRAVNGLQSAIDRMPSGGNSNGSSSITVTVQDNKRTTIAMCCAVFAVVLFLATVIFGGQVLLNMKDHLDAIYMVAPQLRQETSHVTRAPTMPPLHGQREGSGVSQPDDR